MPAPYGKKPAPRTAGAQAIRRTEGRMTKFAPSDSLPPGSGRSRTGRAPGGASDGLFAVDAAGLLTNAHGSAEHVLGASGDESVGQSVWDLLPTELAAAFRATYEEGLVAREETRRIRLSLATVTHELRAPLTVIKAYQQLAERQLGAHFPDAEIAAPMERALQAAREFLAQAQQAAGRLSTLLEDLSYATSAKAGKLRMHQQPCDLAELVRDTVRHLRQTNPTWRIELRLPVARRVLVRADPERIVQVVTNYLTNAFKYSPADQPVKVRVRAWGQVARVAVQDRGPGLGAADKKAIWDSFYQAPGVQLQPGVDAGLGIGLYVCRTIVEQHAGQAGVESAVGRGSTFWFKLPIIANAM